jgi:hypothetical protein
MLDEVAMAISTGAAGNIVAYMLNDQMDALHAQVARMFRHGTGQERSAALRTLEDDAVALTQQKSSKADLTSQWSNYLFSYLTAHPEARGDIESFSSSPVTSKTTNIGSLNHYGSGPQIAGDYIGNMTINGKGNLNG